MSKFLLVPLLVSFVLAFLLVPTVRAQTGRTLGWCKGPVARVVNSADPTKPITSDPIKTPKATFYVNVGRNADFTNWRMKFECGPEWFQKDVDAKKDGLPSEIYYELQNTRGNTVFGVQTSGCEFDPGKHTIQVIAQGTSWTPYCLARYDIVNQDRLCSLDLDPKTGFISGDPIQVSGSDLSQQGVFGLFMDNNLIVQVPVIRSGTNNNQFGPVTIDGTRLAPKKHQIFLRKYNELSKLNPTIPLTPMPPIEIVQNWSEPLCPVNIMVGTPSNPGFMIGVGATVPSQPVISSGPQIPGCNDEKNPGGIVTAIGCIRTNPSNLAADLLKFLLGIGGGIAFLMMLLGAFQMLTSAGNPDTLRAGRERLTSAVIGLLIVIFSVLLLQIIGVGILNIPGFK